MSETCSYCGEKGHSIQECPKWKGKELASATETVFTAEHLDKLNRFEMEIDFDAFESLYVSVGGSKTMAEHLWTKFVGYNHSIVKFWAYLDIENRGLILNIINKWKSLKEKTMQTERSAETPKRVYVPPAAFAGVIISTSESDSKFKEPVLGECTYQFFYITNQFYGGYSAKCEHGSISADYHNPMEVIKLAQKAKMSVNLAGDAWKEIGRKGYGELVSPSEAETLLKELARKRGLPIPAV